MGLFCRTIPQKKIQWSSSDSNTIYVSNGQIKIKTCGTATISAKLPDGSTIKKAVSAKHDYAVTTTNATCKSEGRTVKKCKNCGDTITQTIPKTNKHTFGSWVTTKKATATEDGTETRTCKVCGTVETRALKYKSPVNNSSTATASGESTDSSTQSETSTSDASQQNPIEDTSSGELQNKPDNNIDNSDNNSKSPTSPSSLTGSNDGKPSHIWIPIAVAVGIALVAAVVIIFVRQKKRK